jgi:hypothetical protein
MDHLFELNTIRDLRQREVDHLGNVRDDQMATRLRNAVGIGPGTAIDGGTSFIR